MAKATLKKFAADAVLDQDWPIPTHEEWESLSLDSAHALTQRLQAAYQEGAAILNQRISSAARDSGKYKCIVCGKTRSITVGEGSNARPGYVYKDDRRDPQTGIYTTRYICSQECHFRGSNSGRMTNVGTPSNVHK